MRHSSIDSSVGLSFSSFAATAPDGSYTVTEKLIAPTSSPRLSLQPQPCGCIVAGSTSHVCPAHPQLALTFVRGGDAE